MIGTQVPDPLCVAGGRGFAPAFRGGVMSLCLSGARKSDRD
jgi:hypothetical protein